MKNQLISVGLLSLVLAGCNMTDFRLPTIGESNSNSTATTKNSSASQFNIISNPLVEEMCATAKKNEARANDLYRGKVVSGVGRFDLLDSDTPKIKFEINGFDVSMDINKKTEPWKQYDKGQNNVSSGNVKVLRVSTRTPMFSDNYSCYILGEQ